MTIIPQSGSFTKIGNEKYIIGVKFVDVINVLNRS